MTFNRFFVWSKYPYFISYRGKWVYLFCHGCTIVLLRYPPQEISSDILLRNCLRNYPQKLSSQTPSDILLRNFKHITLIRILLVLSNAIKSCSKLTSIAVLDLLSWSKDCQIQTIPHKVRTQILSLMITVLKESKFITKV